MNVLVLGADGMLGHQLVRGLVAANHEVVAVTRRVPMPLTREALEGARIVTGVDVRILDTIVGAVGGARPAAVLNCIGIVKQRTEAKDALESIRVNSVFPHALASLCATVGARLVHLSTDCVFSGRAGNYTEDDLPDPIDLYGRSKLLGEISAPGCLTLRTSIIGLELMRRESLLEWFLRQNESATGWTRARYSGVTTIELSRLVVRLLQERPDLEGIWQVSSDPITKYDLLVMLRDAIRRDVAIVPDARTSIDRTLDSRRFREAVGYQPPSWKQMISELADAVRRREAVKRV